VAPARTYEPYEADAVATAEEVVSASETALLAVDSAAKDNAYANYLSVVLAESEEDAKSVQGQFESIQPPGEEADRLRVELVKLIDEAVPILEELRIAVRRSEIDSLPDIAAPLEDVSKRLDEFARAHET
jgi:hypothetical protein